MVRILNEKPVLTAYEKKVCGFRCESCGEIVAARRYSRSFKTGYCRDCLETKNVKIPWMYVKCVKVTIPWMTC
jgi:hypothetical protein